MILAPYVGNANVLAWDRSELDKVMATFQLLIRQAKIAYRVEVEGACSFDVVGRRVRLGATVVRNAARRTWRL